MNRLELTKQHFSLFLFAVAALLTGCSSDDFNESESPAVQPIRLTRFSTSSETPQEGPQRTAMNETGTFTWVESDKIWVKKGDQLIPSTECVIGDPATSADFYVEGNFTADSYEVIYNGKDAGSGSTVTIAAEQTQSLGNNSDHFATVGDCASATAVRDPETGDYNFTLNHKASYIIFEPRTAIAPSTNYCKVKHIVVKEKNGRNICGTYPLTSEGLQVDAVTNGGSEIRLVCGVDVEKLPDGRMSADELFAENNGFPIKETVDGDHNRMFMVIAPRTYDLEITYTVAYYIYHSTRVMR